MKALTLNQPWASLVWLEKKKIETRSGSTRYRIDENSLPPYAEVCFGDYATGRYALQREDIRLIEPPVPAVGRLGLWDYTLAGML